MNQTIQLSYPENGIALLTLNRPEARNALSWAMQNHFLETIRTLSLDESVRALIITGAGEQAFCAGADLVELAAFPRHEDGARLAGIMGEALELLENAPFPSIAAMNGYALGGGSELALACDMRVIDAGAYMTFVQVRMGLTPGWGGGQRLLRAVGYSRAMSLLLSTQAVQPPQLEAWGLVTHIAPAGEALSTALDLARNIARWDVGAVRAVKRTLRYGLRLPYDEAGAAERAEFPPLWAAEAHLQAVQDFLSRRKA